MPIPALVERCWTVTRHLPRHWVGRNASSIHKSAGRFRRLRKHGVQSPSSSRTITRLVCRKMQPILGAVGAGTILNLPGPAAPVKEHPATLANPTPPSSAIPAESQNYVGPASAIMQPSPAATDRASDEFLGNQGHSTVLNSIVNSPFPSFVALPANTQYLPQQTSVPEPTSVQVFAFALLSLGIVIWARRRT